MLIEKPEQVLFDFASRYSESMATLDNDILFTSPWGHYPLNDPNGDLLLELLHHQKIMVYSQKYPLERDFSAEDHRKANELADLVGKRNTASILQAVRIYDKREPLKQRNEYNALYYPDLKAYVRFGILHPEKLLDMLNQDNTNAVILFRDCVDSDTEDRFFIFMRRIQLSEYRAIMENAKEKQIDALRKALELADSQSESVFPEWHENE